MPFCRLILFLFCFCTVPHRHRCHCVSVPLFSCTQPNKRHGSTRVPGHAVLAWLISWRMVAYIYYLTAAGDSICSQLGSSFRASDTVLGKGRRYGPSITYKIPPAGSLSSSQPGGPPCWASPLAFGLIVPNLCSQLRVFRNTVPVCHLFLTPGELWLGQGRPASTHIHKENIVNKAKDKLHQ